MTSTTDTAGHPELTEISDLTEGLLPASRTSQLRKHLDECVSCADVHASLEEIRSLLGTLPHPQRMPGDVADRIDAALIAETGTAGDGTGDSQGVGVSRETPTADRPADHAPPSGTGPGRTARTRRRRRRITVLGIACAVTALGVASVVLTFLRSDQQPDVTAHGRSSDSVDTFSEATLGNRVTTLLDQAPKARTTAQASRNGDLKAGPDAGNPNVLKDRPTVAVPSCVRQGIGGTGVPLAAEEGTFNGEDAYLVLLSGPSGDATRITAYIVDATCVSHPSVPAKVLLSRSYPRS